MWDQMSSMVTKIHFANVCLHTRLASSVYGDIVSSYSKTNVININKLLDSLLMIVYHVNFIGKLTNNGLFK